jgi:peptide/nickel transport system substrate-binding protein
MGKRMTTNTSAARRRSTVLIAVLTVALLGVGCQGSTDRWTPGGDNDELLSSGPDNGRPVPVPGGRLVVGVPAETNGWNPFIDQWADSGTMVGTSMIEPLAIQDNDGRAEAWLAERWEPNADHTQWTITIRPGVLFHDGTPLDAAAVKRSLDEAFQTGLYQVALGPLYDRVEVIGPLQVRVHLKVRWAQYPTSLPNAWIMAPSMLDREDKGTVHPIGTGPFRFERWEQGRSLTASRWDRYWRKDARGQQLPYVEGIEFRPVADDTEREAAIRGGRLDIALSAGSDMAGNFQNDFTVIKDYTGQRTFLMLNTKVGAANRGNPFHNLSARRALAMATDRQRIANLVGSNVQSTTYGFRPDSVWAPSGDDGYYDYDPERAKQELNAYRRETGASKLRFNLAMIDAREAQRVAQGLKAMWAEVGIEATIDLIEPPKLVVLASLGQYHASWFRLHDFPDPDQMYFYLSSANAKPPGELALNFTRYASPRLDANIEVLRESVDQRARKLASDDVIRETNEQVVNLWLYDTPASLVARPKVEGLDGFRSHGFNNNLPKPWLSEAWLAR